MDSFVTEASVGFAEQSLKDFLKKPVIIQSGSLTTTDTVSTFAKIVLPKACLTQNLKVNKTSGYLGIKCTLVIRLQVNATRFQQGRYMLTAVHMGGAQAPGTNLISSPGDAWYNSHINTVYARTQLPRVEFDLNCDTEAILRLPFMSSLTYVPLATRTDATNYGNLAIIQLFPYQALQAGSGSTTAQYTIWCSMEDVELYGTATPQSGRMFTAKSISRKEQESMRIGPIESTMVKLGRASSFIAKVPFLSSYATGLSWASDIAANVASVFGWSKPFNLAASHRMTRNSLLYYSNIDGPDNSLPVSMSVKNEVAILPGFAGTDLDEMDFSHICSIPSLYKTYTWSVSDVVGSTVGQINIRPLDDEKIRTVGIYTISDLIPVQFVAKHFQNWRGSLVYTIKFVKTEFHSGRLAIAFFPEEPKSASTSASFTLSDYVAREIIDVRECNEYTFTVPYVSSTPYRPATSAGSRNGVVGIYVLDPLQAPNTVTQTVTMFVEMSGGPDLEFFHPTPFTASPAVNITPQSGNMFTVSDCKLAEGTLGNSIQRYASTISSEVCVGEKISNFRSLIKSMYRLVKPSAEATTHTCGVIIPYGIQTLDVVNEPTTQDACFGDLYTQLGSIFLLSRGGNRLKLQPVTSFSGTNTNLLEQFTMINMNNISPGVGLTSVWTPMAANIDPSGRSYLSNSVFGLRALANITEEKSMEVSIPQYSITHSRCNVDHWVGAGTGIIMNFGIKSLVTPSIGVWQNNSDSSANFHVYRGGSDDINFGGFVSIPPMYISST